MVGALAGEEKKKEGHSVACVSAPKAQLTLLILAPIECENLHGTCSVCMAGMVSKTKLDALYVDRSFVKPSRQAHGLHGIFRPR